MIADAGTLDLLDPSTFDASVAQYGLPVTSTSDLRDILMTIAGDFTVDAPYHTFAEYIGALQANLDTWEVSLQCILLGLMPEGAFLTQTTIDDFLAAVYAFSGGDEYLWHKVYAIGTLTTLAGWAALVNSARAIGGDYDCDGCADTHAWCRRDSFEDGADDWAIRGAGEGVLSGGAWHEGSSGLLAIYKNLPAGTVLEHVDYNYAYTIGGGGFKQITVYLYDGLGLGGSVLGSAQIFPVANTVAGNLSMDGSWAARSIMINIYSDGGAVSVKDVKLAGSATPVDGAGNC